MNDRKPMEHELKVLPQFYNGIASHRKTFEIRKDDRDYQVGDRILLREFDGEKYTRHQTRRIITYILRNAKEYGLADGYCILGIQPIGWDYIHQTTLMQKSCADCILDQTDACPRGAGRAVDDEICGAFLEEEK